MSIQTPLSVHESRQRPIAWSTRPAPTSCSTPTTRWTGIPGERRPSRQARLENKPIFLSVGYSTCYWCHVMERESFENPEVAEFMNKHFINIKVDREERPDVDDVYMSAVQLMTRRRWLAHVRSSWSPTPSSPSMAGPTFLRKIKVRPSQVS